MAGSLYIPCECWRSAISSGRDARIFCPSAELRPNLLSTGIGGGGVDQPPILVPSVPLAELDAAGKVSVAGASRSD